MKLFWIISAAFLPFTAELCAQGIPGGEGASSQTAPRRATQPGRSAPDGMEIYRQNPQLMKRYGLTPPPGAPEQFTYLGQLNSPSGHPSQVQKNEPTFSITFHGGPPQTLVAVLKKAVGDDAPNIMISPSLENLEIPAFELHNITFNDLFQALNNLSGPNQQGQWQLSGSNQPIWVLNPVAAPQGIDPLTGQWYRNGIPVPNAFNPGGGFATTVPTGNRACQIFPVAQYLTVYKVEDITTAIQTAWGMLGDDGGAQMKLHKDTDLLIAVGTAEQLSVINQILSSLDAGLRAKANYARPEIPGSDHHSNPYGSAAPPKSSATKPQETTEPKPKPNPNF